jgi:leucyl-tRNA synthetase
MDTGRPPFRYDARLWRLIIDESTGEPLIGADAALDPATARLLHRTIAVVREDFLQ